MEKAQIIRVTIEGTDNGLLRATSPDLKGLHVVAQDDVVLRQRTTAMMSDLFELSGRPVNIFEAEEIGAIQSPWIVVPKSADA